MTITARFPSTCPSCSGPITPGSQVHWEKGQKVRHVSCAAAGAGASSSAAAQAEESAKAAGPRSIKLERQGRRTWFSGDTISVRGLLRAGGAHWDADAGAWWIGDHAKAEELAEAARKAPAEKRPPSGRCAGCRCRLNDFQRTRGFRFCSEDCATEARMGSGWSGRLPNGSWHQGSDD